MNGDSFLLNNPYSMGIMKPSDEDPFIVIRSKEMAVTSLRQELEDCSVPHLRKIAHAIYGKGSWISFVQKKPLIERLLKAEKEIPDLEKGLIARLIREKQQETKMEKTIFTPRIKSIVDLLATEIGRSLVQYLKKAKAEEGL